MLLNLVIKNRIMLKIIIFFSLKTLYFYFSKMKKVCDKKLFHFRKRIIIFILIMFCWKIFFIYISQNCENILVLYVNCINILLTGWGWRIFLYLILSQFTKYFLCGGFFKIIIIKIKIQSLGCHISRPRNQSVSEKNRYKIYI